MTDLTAYLDNNSASCPSEKCLSTMISALPDCWPTLSSPYQSGQVGFAVVEKALKDLYQLLGADHHSDILITSSVAEAVNHVIMGVYYQMAQKQNRNHFLTATTDEAPAIVASARLEQMGCIASKVPVNSEGIVTADAVAESLTPRTALLSLSWANGLTGVIHPVEDILQVCRERGVLLHLEASHIVGKMYDTIEDVDADFISFGASKIHGPAAMAALYIRRGRDLLPLIVGDHSQGGQRAGDINIAALAGFGVAAKEAVENRDYLCTEVAALRDRLEEGIKKNVCGAKVLFKENIRLPHCSLITIPKINNEALLYILNSKGVYASIGGGSFQQVALNLAAAGVLNTEAQGSISFSLSRYTTKEEVDYAVDVVTQGAKMLQALSKGIASDIHSKMGE